MTKVWALWVQQKQTTEVNESKSERGYPLDLGLGKWKQAETGQE